MSPSLLSGGAAPIFSNDPSPKDKCYPHTAIEEDVLGEASTPFLTKISNGKAKEGAVVLQERSVNNEYGFQASPNIIQYP